jgi:hypothetical protein
MKYWHILPVLVLFTVVGCTDDSALITGCDAIDDKVPLCGWQRPEDMELLPDGEHIIVSEMEEEHGAIAGHLSLLNTKTSKRIELDHSNRDSNELLWGDSDCNVPPADNLAPHGIHLSLRDDQRVLLLVVNHGAREAVEFYEVIADTQSYKLTWRGCVIPPEGSFLNDVVAVNGGGFAATHMFTKTDDRLGSLSGAEIKALLGFNPGQVLYWSQGNFQQLPGLEGSYNNGIQVADDGNTLFVNYWGGSKVVKYDLSQRKVLAEVEVIHPDNSQWDSEGRLLVASHDFSLSDFWVCMTQEVRACPGAYSIVAVDPDAMTKETIIEHHGAPMGAATVAMPVGDFIYMGSFIGDRIMRMPYVNNLNKSAN